MYDLPMDILPALLRAGTIAEIKRDKAPTQSSTGSTVENQKTISRDNPVRVRQLSPRANEVKDLGAERGLTTHRLYFLPDVDVENTDTVIITRRGTTEVIGTFDMGPTEDPHELGEHKTGDAKQRIPS